MIDVKAQVESAAKGMGVPAGELAAILEKGQTVAYEGGAFLFHESTPRQWFGIVLGGQVDVGRGLRGRQTHLATLNPGSLISEGLLLDDCAHSSSAFARGGKAQV